MQEEGSTAFMQTLLCVFSCVGNSLEQVNPQSPFAMRSKAEFRALTFACLSVVSLYPHDALAVSVIRQLAEMELFNVGFLNVAIKLIIIDIAMKEKDFLGSAQVFLL